LLFAVKLNFSLVIHLCKRRGVGTNTNNRISKELDDEELLADDQGVPSGQNGLDSMTSQQPHRLPLRVWTGRSMLFVSVVAAFYVLRDHTVSRDVLLLMMFTHMILVLDSWTTG